MKKADSAQQLDINGVTTIGNDDFQRAIGDGIGENGVQRSWTNATIITTQIANQIYRRLGMPERRRCFSTI